jgi:hypothetical protein
LLSNPAFDIGVGPGAIVVVVVAGRVVVVVGAVVVLGSMVVVVVELVVLVVVGAVVVVAGTVVVVVVVVAAIISTAVEPIHGKPPEFDEHVCQPSDDVQLEFVTNSVFVSSSVPSSFSDADSTCVP